MLTRRLFMAAPTIAWVPGRVSIAVEQGDSVRRDASVQLAGGGVFSFPARRARLLAVLRLRGEEVVAVAFAADPPGGIQDLLALVGSDGGLLALERLAWQAGPGGTLSTRIAMLPDRSHISLERSAARHDDNWRREAWTDYLRLTDGTLVDAPARPVLPGSWQFGLSRQRAEMAGRIAPASRTIAAEWVAAMQGSALV